MNAKTILRLMDIRKHCAECGAMLANARGTCPHCGFEEDVGEDETVLSYRTSAGWAGADSRKKNKEPESIYDEAA